MKLMGRVIAFGALALSMSHLSFADEIIIPFALREREFVKDLKKKGIDLTDSKDSEGFLQSRGQEVSVMTYKNMNDEELGIITAAAFKNMRE